MLSEEGPGVYLVLSIFFVCLFPSFLSRLLDSVGLLSALVSRLLSVAGVAAVSLLLALGRRRLGWMLMGAESPIRIVFYLSVFVAVWRAVSVFLFEHRSPTHIFGPAALGFELATLTITAVKLVASLYNYLKMEGIPCLILGGSYAYPDDTSYILVYADIGG